MTPKGKWFDILKVDIDFDKDIRGLGEFWRRQFVSLDDLKEAEKTGEDIVWEGIRINHHKIKRQLKRKLHREPTDEELIEYIKRVIMHEAGHAGHHQVDEGYESSQSEQKEYVAYMFQFPDSVYLALRNLLKHPKSRKRTNPKWVSDYLRVNDFKKQTETIRKLLQYVNRYAKTSKDKEELTRVELAHRKYMTRFSKNNFPQNLSQAEARYNKKFSKFIKKLFGDK